MVPTTRRAIELLAPAKDPEQGMAAIDCGADAVYIGASAFGARYAAANDPEAITRLIDYARPFGAKVYITLNTLLFDHELEQARTLAFRLADLGADALIVQDMAYATFGLPLPLHASTQAATLTPQRAKMLEAAGFRRIVTERAFSLEQIEAIRRAAPGTELEAFVHGAICVSYSGQCYLGEVVSGRSGNRGVCSQPCRSTYNLVDGTGKVLLRGKHLLSLRDLSLHEHLEEMIDAGVSSFKIEGRLKDLTYLRNSVAFYRRELDRIMEQRDDLMRPSLGKSRVPFEPNLDKGFSRGFTDYFIGARKPGKGALASFETGKAVGEYIGKVRTVGHDFFTLEKPSGLHNGDGICFTGREGTFRGTNINRAEGERIFPNRMEGLEPGVALFRNYDHAFASLVKKQRPERRIGCRIDIRFEPETIRLTATHPFAAAELTEPALFEKAQQPDRMRETLKTQLAKSGDTIFRITEVTVENEPLFIPVSEINRMRREVLGRLKEALAARHRPEPCAPTAAVQVAHGEPLDYKANVTNRRARAFYEASGFGAIAPGIELLKEPDYPKAMEVMRMKYCLRQELGWCLKEGGPAADLFLENGQRRFRLLFDCKRCEMALIRA